MALCIGFKLRNQGAALDLASAGLGDGVAEHDDARAALGGQGGGLESYDRIAARFAQ